MSNSNRVLLDKNVARNFLSALVKVALNIPLPESEQIALQVVNGKPLEGKDIYIVEATDNVLKPLAEKYPEVRDFRSRVEVIIPSEYWRRWSRRLQSFGFTRARTREFWG